MAAHAERIDLASVLRERILTREQRRELRQIDSAREVRSMSEYHGAPQFGIRFIKSVSVRQVMEHRRVEGITFGDTIQPDQQHVAVTFLSDVGHSGTARVPLRAAVIREIDMILVS